MGGVIGTPGDVSLFTGFLSPRWGLNILVDSDRGKFPEYAMLIDDMKAVNQIMLRYADWLQRIVRG